MSDLIVGGVSYGKRSEVTEIVLPTSRERAFNWFTSLLNMQSILYYNWICNQYFTTIGDYAFRGCTSLVNIVIPQSVTTIGVGAFRGCTSLVNIVIPQSVTTIGDCAFRDCTALDLLSKAANKSIEEFLRDRYSRYSQRKAVLLSINKVTELRSKELPRRRRRLEHANGANVREEFNGLLAYDMITAEEMWREILKFV